MAFTGVVTAGLASCPDCGLWLGLQVFGCCAKTPPEARATVARIRRAGNQYTTERGLDMTTMGVLLWFAVLMIGFFVGLKTGSS